MARTCKRPAATGRCDLPGGRDRSLTKPEAALALRTPPPILAEHYFRGCELLEVAI